MSATRLSFSQKEALFGGVTYHVTAYIGGRWREIGEVFGHYYEPSRRRIWTYRRRTTDAWSAFASPTRGQAAARLLTAQGYPL